MNRRKFLLSSLAISSFSGCLGLTNSDKTTTETPNPQTEEELTVSPKDVIDTTKNELVGDEGRWALTLEVKNKFGSPNQKPVEYTYYYNNPRKVAHVIVRSVETGDMIREVYADEEAIYVNSSNGSVYTGTESQNYESNISIIPPVLAKSILSFTSFTSTEQHTDEYHLYCDSEKFVHSLSIKEGFGEYDTLTSVNLSLTTTTELVLNVGNIQIVGETENQGEVTNYVKFDYDLDYTSRVEEPNWVTEFKN